METRVAGTVLTIAGIEELTGANQGQFREQVCAVWSEHTLVEVDLSQTKAMDSRGLGALIAVRNLASSRNAPVRLVGVAPAVKPLFDLVRAGHLFEIAQVKASSSNRAGS